MIVLPTSAFTNQLFKYTIYHKMAEITYLEQECIKQIFRTERENKKLRKVLKKLMRKKKKPMPKSEYGCNVVKNDPKGISENIMIGEFDYNKMCENPACCYLGDLGYGGSFQNLLGQSFVRRMIDSQVGKVDSMKLFIRGPRLVAVLEQEYKHKFKDFTIYNPMKKNKNTEMEELGYILNESLQKIENFHKTIVVNENTKAYIPAGTKKLKTFVGFNYFKQKWNSNDNFSELSYNGRHYEIGYMVPSLSPHTFKPQTRSNFDYVFISSTDGISQRKGIYQNYAGIVPYFSVFDRIFSVLTCKDSLMVIANRSTYADYMNLSSKIKWTNPLIKFNEDMTRNKVDYTDSLQEVVDMDYAKSQIDSETGTKTIASNILNSDSESDSDTGSDIESEFEIDPQIKNVKFGL